MRFKDKVMVITGGARGIGACTAKRFCKEGAKVEIIDKAEGDWFVGDIADPTVLERFAEFVISKHGHIDILLKDGCGVYSERCTSLEVGHVLNRIVV